MENGELEKAQDICMMYLKYKQPIYNLQNKNLKSARINMKYQ